MCLISNITNHIPDDNKAAKGFLNQNKNIHGAHTP